MGFPIINLWGTRFTSVFFIFSVMAGWIAEILFMLFFAYTYRYSSGQLIPIFQSVAVAEVGIKGPLEYLQLTPLFLYFLFI